MKSFDRTAHRNDGALPSGRLRRKSRALSHRLRLHPLHQAVSPTPTVSAATEPDTAKTGLGVVNSIAKSKDAGDSDGIAQVDSSAAAVLIGPDGKIISCGSIRFRQR